MSQFGSARGAGAGVGAGGGGAGGALNGAGAGRVSAVAIGAACAACVDFLGLRLASLLGAVGASGADFTESGGSENYPVEAR